MIIKNRKPKLAQYNQFDGYPDHFGKNLLIQLKTIDLDTLQEQIDKIRFAGEKKSNQIMAFYEKIKSNTPKSVDDIFFEKYPLMHRNTGPELLDNIMKLDKIVFAKNSSDFAGDSLFCEWAYIIDLDKETFETFKGFNKEPLNQQERFFKYQDKNAEYKPVRLSLSYDLDNLPTVEDYLLNFKN